MVVADFDLVCVAVKPIADRLFEHMESLQMQFGADAIARLSVVLEVSQPPDSLSLRSTAITHIPRGEVPMPGLRAVLYHDRQPSLHSALRGLGVVIYDP